MRKKHIFILMSITAIGFQFIPEVDTFPGHSGHIHTAAFSPDAKSIATIRYGEDIIRVWDAATRRERTKLDTRDLSVLLRFKFSPDGKSLAAWDDTSIVVWDISTGTERCSFRQHPTKLGNVTFTSDGASLVALYKDDTLRLWELATAKQLEWAQAPKRIHRLISCTFGPLAVDDQGKWWNLATRAPFVQLIQLDDTLCDLIVSPDGKTLAGLSYRPSIGRCYVRLWNLDTSLTPPGVERRAVMTHPSSTR